jgi:hypothetical protein
MKTFLYFWFITKLYYVNSDVCLFLVLCGHLHRRANLYFFWDSALRTRGSRWRDPFNVEWLQPAFNSMTRYHPVVNKNTSFYLDPLQLSDIRQTRNGSKQELLLFPTVQYFSSVEPRTESNNPSSLKKNWFPWYRTLYM